MALCELHGCPVVSWTLFRFNHSGVANEMKEKKKRYGLVATLTRLSCGGTNRARVYLILLWKAAVHGVSTTSKRTNESS
jgi:hypothetical protein